MRSLAPTHSPFTLVLLSSYKHFYYVFFQCFFVKMKADVSIFLTFPPFLHIMIHTEYLLLYLAFFT